jgi:putative intracellular protease/amidase
MSKLLFAMTGTSYWTLKDGTRHPTGYWAEEFATPYRAATKVGVESTRAEIWKPYTVVDRNLYTGQNPASAAPLAEQVLAALH